MLVPVRMHRILAAVLLLVACSPVPSAAAPSATVVPTTSLARPTPTAVPTLIPTPSPTPRLTPTPCRSDQACGAIESAIAAIDPAKMNDHLLALTSVLSRDPRNPGHAKAVAYIKEQLGALAYYGWKIESQRTVYQGIPLENIFATIDLKPVAADIGPIGPVGNTGWILISAHYDSTANRTPGWRPSIDPAPGADDNATGTAALLEFARVLSTYRPTSAVQSRIVLAFFDGEELFFKGSGAYMSTLPKPYPYKAAINLDMV